MTEDGVLELELRHAPTSGQDSDEADEHEVGEGSQGATDATYRRQSSADRVLDPHTAAPTGRWVPAI